MSSKVSIMWFRSDLRISDNPALVEGVKNGKVIPVFVYDDNAPSICKLGSCSKLWLHHSLESLNKSLGGKLNLLKGDSPTLLLNLAKKHKVSGIYCNECYEPWNLKQTLQVERHCKGLEIDFGVFQGSFLWDFDDLNKDNGDFYKVFSPFKRNAFTNPPRETVKSPRNLSCITVSGSASLQSLNLLPKKEWDRSILECWKIGETAAQNKLSSFLKGKLSSYKTGRDFPAKNLTSHLSPHLHFGEISPSQIYESAKRSTSSSSFLDELAWREFSTYLLFHFEGLYQENFNPKFDKYPWKSNPKFLRAWQKGNTGYPIVDAGMKELWKTGYMHNRVRMITASFLIKNLNIHWHKGRDWFWDCLVDADLANNSASWQWVAGCGVDAAPFFRIFNPITQGEKFDKEGDYIKTHLPQLKKIPSKYIHKPWEAPEEILEYAGVEIGKDYPHPIVDLKETREKALANFKKI